MKTPVQTKHVNVTSLDLAAMLVTLGFRLRSPDPITLLIDENKRKHFTAHFEETTTHDVFGPITMRQVLAIYSDDAEARSEADKMLVELIDHMREKDRAKNTFLDIIRPKEKGGQGLVKPRGVFPVSGGWTGSLPIDASPDLQRRFKAMVAKVV